MFFGRGFSHRGQNTSYKVHGWWSENKTWNCEVTSMDASVAGLWWWTFAQSFGGLDFGSPTKNWLLRSAEQEFVYYVYTCKHLMLDFFLGKSPSNHLCWWDYLFGSFVVEPSKIFKFQDKGHVFSSDMSLPNCLHNNYGHTEIHGCCQQGFVEFLVNSYLVTFLTESFVFLHPRKLSWY